MMKFPYQSVHARLETRNGMVRLMRSVSCVSNTDSKHVSPSSRASGISIPNMRHEKQHKNHILQQIGCFSSYNNKYKKFDKSEPPKFQNTQYFVKNDESVFVMKPFQTSYGATNNLGSLLVEIAPRDLSSTFVSWGDKINISLTVSEMGLILVPRNIYPETGIEILRKAKVLNVLPLDDGSMEFKLTLKQGEDDPFQNLNISETEIEAKTITHTLKPGEFEVLKILFRQCIPKFLGWSSGLENETNNQFRKTPSTASTSLTSGGPGNKSKGVFSPDGPSDDIHF